MKQSFKLKREIKTVPDCPHKCVNSRITAFRFVHEHLLNDSFKTYFEMGIKSKFENRCDELALSFFDSEENARNKFNVLKKSFHYIDKKIGGHIAVGDILENDGEITKISNDGHFNFFEYENIDIPSKFKIIGKL